MRAPAPAAESPPRLSNSSSAAATLILGGASFAHPIVGQPEQGGYRWDCVTSTTHAVQTAKSLRMDGAAEERDGKLHFKGTVNSEDEKNQIWNAVKTVPDWQKEVVADITVRPSTMKDPTPSRSAAPQQAPVRARGRRWCHHLHGAAGRYTERDRQEVPGQCQRLHGNLQRQPRSAERPGQNQAGTGSEDSAARQEISRENRPEPKLLLPCALQGRRTDEILFARRRLHGGGTSSSPAAPLRRASRRLHSRPPTRPAGTSLHMIGWLAVYTSRVWLLTATTRTTRASGARLGRAGISRPISRLKSTRR